jgi:DNA polymerase-3 subunit epsilon
LIVAALTIIWLIAFWHGLSPSQESLFVHIFRQRFVVIFVAAFFSLCAFALLLGAVLHYYLIPLKRLVEETTLIATINPSHRIRMEGARDILRVAEAVNEGAARFQRLQDSVREEIRISKHREMEERNILAAVIGQMSEGVLLCNHGGVILLYNHRARQILSPNGTLRGGMPVFVGLGRSLMDIVESAELRKAFEELERQHAVGNRHPVRSLVIGTSGNREVRLRITRMMNCEDTKAGFLLTCREMTEEGSAFSDAESFEEVFDDDEASRLACLLRPNSALSEELSTVGSQVIHSSRPEFFDFDLLKQAPRNSEMESWSLTDLSYTVFDTETTGLDPVGGDEIIAIGAIRIVNGRILYGERFEQLVDPRCYMKPEAVRIHGITSDMLEGQPTIDMVLPAFRSFVGDTVLVGHNCAFDMRFLQLKEEKTGIRFLNPVLDTLLLSAVVHPNQETHSFEAIAKRMGVDVVGRHNALGDAILTAKIFTNLIPLLKNERIKTLGEAIAASRQTYFARLRY